MRTILIIACMVVLAACQNNDDDQALPDDDVVYFLVAEVEPAHGDSFVLALQDPQNIAEARAIINGASDPKIILAEIALEDEGPDVYNNKDLKQNRDWSWYCVEFKGFYDNTIEIYDGWPEYVEENYEEWVNNRQGEGENGVIGFWNYTVSREVDPSELD